MSKANMLNPLLGWVPINSCLVFSHVAGRLLKRTSLLSSLPPGRSSDTQSTSGTGKWFEDLRERNNIGKKGKKIK